MGKLIRYRDGWIGHWSRISFDKGKPIKIDVSLAGVVVKESTMGIMGEIIYKEPNLHEASKTALALEQEIDQYITPAEMTSFVLKVFTQIALNCDSSAELLNRINRPLGLESTNAYTLDRGPRAKNREQVIKDYGKYIEHYAVGLQFRDVTELPHPKEEILDAILTEIVLNEDTKTVEALKITAVMLANFQENVGPNPLTMHGITEEEWCKDDFPNVCVSDELIQKVTNYVHSSDRKKYDSLSKIVEEEKIDIVSKLNEAEELKKQILEDM